MFQPDWKKIEGLEHLVTLDDGFYHFFDEVTKVLVTGEKCGVLFYVIRREDGVSAATIKSEYSHLVLITRWAEITWPGQSGLV